MNETLEVLGKISTMPAARDLVRYIDAIRVAFRPFSDGSVIIVPRHPPDQQPGKT